MNENKGKLERKYEGIVEFILPDYEMAEFYITKKINNRQIYLNEYVLIQDMNGDYVKDAVFKYKENGLYKVDYKVITNNFIDILKPRNLKQRCCFDLLQDNNIPVKLITGNQGGGKTYLAIHTALENWERHEMKIVYIRNNIDVKDTMQIGSLPGSLKDKLLPYVMPIADCVGDIKALDILEEKGRIEYVHLGFIRGRSFSNATIIVSEAENLTEDHVKLLIGRVGEGSIIIFEGDTSQVDKKVFELKSGIQALKDTLGGNKMFGSVHLDKSERSKTAQLAELFNNRKEKNYKENYQIT